MSDFLMSMAVAFVLAELLSLGGLWLGGRMIDRPWLRRIGARSHAQKIRALDKVWPMTRIRPAIERGDVRTLIAIVTALVALKSAGALAVGLIAIFWLPLGSTMVPAIVAAEDAHDPALVAWAERVARLQVTSHVAAAALGFALTLAGPLRGRALGAVVRENLWSVVVALSLAAGFAVAAGKTEALGLAKRGI